MKEYAVRTALFFLLTALLQRASAEVCDPKGALSFCSAVDKKCPKTSEELYTHTVCEEKYAGKKCCRMTCSGSGSQCFKDSCSTQGLQDSPKKCPSRGYHCCTRSTNFNSVLKQKPVLPAGTNQGGSNQTTSGSASNLSNSSTGLQPGTSNQQEPTSATGYPSGAQSYQENSQQSGLQSNIQRPATQQGTGQQLMPAASPLNSVPGYNQANTSTINAPHMENLWKQPTSQNQQQQQLSPPQQQNQQKLNSKQRQEEQKKLQHLHKNSPGQRTQRSQSWFDKMKKLAQSLPSSTGNELNSQQFGAEHTIAGASDNNKQHQPSNPPSAALLPDQPLRQPQSATQEHADHQPLTSAITSQGPEQMPKEVKWNSKKSPSLMPILQKYLKVPSRRKQKKES